MSQKKMNAQFRNWLFECPKFFLKDDSKILRLNKFLFVLNQKCGIKKNI